MRLRAIPLEGDFVRIDVKVPNEYTCRTEWRSRVIPLVGAAFRDGCDQDERDIHIEMMGRVARALLNGTPFPRWRGPHPNATLGPRTLCPICHHYHGPEPGACWADGEET